MAFTEKTADKRTSLFIWTSCLWNSIYCRTSSCMHMFYTHINKVHTGISYQQHKGPESSCCASEGRHPWYPQFESLEVCWKAQSSRMRMESGEWLKQWPQTTLWKNGTKYCSKYLQFILFLRKLLQWLSYCIVQ